jgi:hypothetical protein
MFPSFPATTTSWNWNLSRSNPRTAVGVVPVLSNSGSCGCGCGFLTLGVFESVYSLLFQIRFVLPIHRILTREPTCVNSLDILWICEIGSDDGILLSHRRLARPSP